MSSKTQAEAKTGRILRLKLGYNPNSSSIGTIVFALPAAMLGLTVAFGAAAGLLSAAALRAPGTEEDSEPPPKDDGLAAGEESAEET